MKSPLYERGDLEGFYYDAILLKARTERKTQTTAFEYDQSRKDFVESS